VVKESDPSTKVSFFSPQAQCTEIERDEERREISPLSCAKVEKCIYFFTKKGIIKGIDRIFLGWHLNVNLNEVEIRI